MSKVMNLYQVTYVFETVVEQIAVFCDENVAELWVSGQTPYIKCTDSGKTVHVLQRDNIVCVVDMLANTKGNNQQTELNELRQKTDRKLLVS
jgi:hypothetical protein